MCALLDPESMFGVCDGFDISIGNLPYVRADEQSAWNQRQRQAILDSKQYETLWEKWDLYVPFIERSYKLLRPGGISTLIVSDAFCHSKYAQKSQNWFLHNARILRLDFCGDLKIFEPPSTTSFTSSKGRRHLPHARAPRPPRDVWQCLSPTEVRVGEVRIERSSRKTRGTQSSSCKRRTDEICYVSKGMIVHADEEASHKVLSRWRMWSPTTEPIVTSTAIR